MSVNCEMGRKIKLKIVNFLLCRIPPSSFSPSSPRNASTHTQFLRFPCTMREVYTIVSLCRRGRRTSCLIFICLIYLFPLCAAIFLLLSERNKEVEESWKWLFLKRTRTMAWMLAGRFMSSCSRSLNFFIVSELLTMVEFIIESGVGWARDLFDTSTRNDFSITERNFLWLS
jgi:hypothetical protein